MKIPHGIGGLRPDTIDETAVSVKNLQPASGGAKAQPMAPIIGRFKGASALLKKTTKAKKKGK